jgi:hypothetical protein
MNDFRKLGMIRAISREQKKEPGAGRRAGYFAASVGSAAGNTYNIATTPVAARAGPPDDAAAPRHRY